MRWHRLMAMARKEVIQILRDSRSLFIVVIMPITLMLLFGYGVSLDIKHTPVCALDREGSQQSQDLLKRFQASEYFDIVEVVPGYPALLEALDSGRCRLGVVVPHDFSRQLAAGGRTAVQVLVDATDDNTANVIFGYTEAVIAGYASEVRLEWLGRRTGQTRTLAPLTVEARTWFNEELESKAFIVPGVVAIVMAVIGAFLTSLTIAREWERGTMEQLVSTPVTRLEVMLGKLAPYFVIGMFDVVLCTAIGIAWFAVPFRGHPVTLFASSGLFLVVVLGIGYFFSVVAKSQLAASQAALVSTFLPAFLLSGFLFSIDQMPAVVRAIPHVIPARYYGSVLKDVFLKGSSLAQLREDLLALTVFAAIIGALATNIFQKRLG
jgi:ABC-2 type transport system permease protein